MIRTALFCLPVGVFLATSCTPYQQRGAGVGALGGAAVGAIAGDSGGDVVRGAALGAALGTGVAAIHEDSQRRAEERDRQYRDDRGYGGNAPPASRDSYPYAERTSNPNQVLSPYAPYNVIDVTGFRSGQLARDPSNQKIFRIP